MHTTSKVLIKAVGKLDSTLPSDLYSSLKEQIKLLNSPHHGLMFTYDFHAFLIAIAFIVRVKLCLPIKVTSTSIYLIRPTRFTFRYRLVMSMRKKLTSKPENFNVDVKK